jgi:enoyl-CoA hydratase/carnithine racemase
MMDSENPVVINDHVTIETRGCAGLITLNRPKALNALSLPMIRQITAALLEWRAQPAIKLVAIRGMGKNPAHATDSAAPAFTPFGSFCAGGDIRYFHQAIFAGDPSLEDFFTEEYQLNYLIHTYPKPYIAFMDGIVFGGGMGISQGASHRIVTERTKMAMPETGIGLFPDVGGGYFLSRCPGRVGEYLALTGQMIGGHDAVASQLADVVVGSAVLTELWTALPALLDTSKASISQLLTTKKIAAPAMIHWATDENRLKIDAIFAKNSVLDIINALEQDASPWATETAVTLRKRSPLMLHVVLEQVRRARGMSLADDLRMERDMVRHCFHTHHLARTGAASETVEGIRALAVDKDHTPKWNPARIEDVTPEMVEPFFTSPWPAPAHPLRDLG